MKPGLQVNFYPIKSLRGLAEAIAILFIASHLYSSQTTFGGAGILTQPIGARQIATGEAFTAVADDVNTIYYNPAGLTSIDKELSINYLKGLIDTYYASMSYGKKLKKNNSLGLSLYLYQAGTIDVPDDTGEQYSTKRLMDNYLFTIGYAKTFKNYPLAFGTNVKLLHSILLEEYRATSIMCDVGVLYHLNFIKGLSAGAAMQNLGSGLKYKETEFPLPVTFRAGLAYQFLGKFSGLRLALDLVKIYDSPNGINVGIEFCAGKNITFRTGYKFEENMNYFSIGLGININKTGIDYSQSLGAELENLYQTSIVFNSKGSEEQTSGIIPEVILEKTPEPIPEVTPEIKEEQQEIQKSSETPTQPIISDRELLDQIESDIIPVFILIKKGYYSFAKQQLDMILSEGHRIKDKNKLIDKLNKIMGITDEITKDEPISEIMRKGLVSFLQPAENPKDALLKAYYAYEKTPDEKDKEVFRNICEMLRNYYPDLARTEAIPQGFKLIDFKLFKALNNIYDGHYDIAIQESQEVLDLEPDNILALKRLGSALYCLGSVENKPEIREQGREIWKKILTLSPDDAEIKEFLEKK